MNDAFYQFTVHVEWLVYYFLQLRGAKERAKVGRGWVTRIGESHL